MAATHRTFESGDIWQVESRDQEVDSTSEGFVLCCLPSLSPLFLFSFLFVLEGTERALSI